MYVKIFHFNTFFLVTFVSKVIFFWELLKRNDIDDHIPYL